MRGDEEKRTFCSNGLAAERSAALTKMLTLCSVSGVSRCRSSSNRQHCPPTRRDAE